ncbi:unnamed protein product, partial [marine sediment metagenome]
IGTELGNWNLEAKGKGIMLNTGMYQIGLNCLSKSISYQVNHFSIVPTGNLLIPLWCIGIVGILYSLGILTLTLKKPKHSFLGRYLVFCHKPSLILNKSLIYV